MFSKKFIILLTVFVDILGLGIVIPVLAYYALGMGATPFQVTLLFTVFSLFGFISAPFLGALSDRIGRRPVLLVSIASTALGWFIFAGAGSVIGLFIGRIIDGAAAGNFPIAQSYLTDLAKDDKERTHNLGLIGMMFGIGLTIGPMIGGLLSHYGHAVPFWFAAGLATLNLLLAIFFLPETHHHRTTEGKMNMNPLAPIIRAITDKPMLPSFIALFLFSCAIAAQQTVFSLYIDRIFHLSATTAGWFFTGMGVLIAVNQGVFLKKFWLKHFSEPRLEIMMFVMMAIGFALSALPVMTTFIASMILLVFGQSVLRVVMSSQLVAQRPERRGEILGVTTSIMSLAMIIAPLGAGMLFETHPTWPYLAASLTCMLALLVILLFKKRFATTNLPVDAPLIESL